MLPPAVVRIDLLLWLDGPSGTGQIGPMVQHGYDRDTVLLEVHPAIPLEQIRARALAKLAELIDLELDRLSPF